MIAHSLDRRDVKNGYTICDCGEYAHVFRQQILNKLPKDYTGEMCRECNMWRYKLEHLDPSRKKHA
ncbi:MAG: hypothetical protein AB1898_09755 [Acidobacteriota bacterium]